MNLGATVFAQLMDYIDPHEFRQIVRRHNTSGRKYRFTCWDQYLAMAFAHHAKEGGIRAHKLVRQSTTYFNEHSPVSIFPLHNLAVG